MNGQGVTPFGPLPFVTGNVDVLRFCIEEPKTENGREAKRMVLALFSAFGLSKSVRTTLSLRLRGIVRELGITYYYMYLEAFICSIRNTSWKTDLVVTGSVDGHVKIGWLPRRHGLLNSRSKGKCNVIS